MRNQVTYMLDGEHTARVDYKALLVEAEMRIFRLRSYHFATGGSELKECSLGPGGNRVDVAKEYG